MNNDTQLKEPIKVDKLEKNYDLPAMVLCVLLSDDEGEYALRNVSWVKNRREAHERRRSFRVQKNKLEDVGLGFSHYIRAISIMPDKSLRMLINDAPFDHITGIEAGLISSFMDNGGDLVCETIEAKLDRLRSFDANG